MTDERRVEVARALLESGARPDTRIKMIAARFGLAHLDVALIFWQMAGEGIFDRYGRRA